MRWIPNHGYTVFNQIYTFFHNLLSASNNIISWEKNTFPYNLCFSLPYIFRGFSHLPDPRNFFVCLIRVINDQTSIP